MTEKRPYKRQLRNVLIHRPMQREFTLILVALLMVSALAIGFVIHDTIREAALGGGFRFGKINPYEVLSDVKAQLMARIAVILAVTMVITGIFAVFFLHRVAGPVYRFRQSLMRLNQGDYPPNIRLREGDFFSETAEEINKLIGKWREDRDKINAVRKKVDQILTGPAANPELSQSAKEIKEIVDRA